MFSSNLSNYVFRKNARRLRDDRISLVVAFVFSVLMLALGQDERAATIEGLVVLGASMLLLTLYSSWNSAQIAERLQHINLGSSILYRPVGRRLVLFSGSILLGFFSLAEGAAQVINRTIRRATRDGILSPHDAGDVSSAFAIATAVPLKLPDATRMQAYQAIKNSGLRDSGSQPLVKCATEIVRYSREVSFTPMPFAKPITGSSEAREAYRTGARYALQVLSGPPLVPTGNLQAADEGKKWLSRAIELSDGIDADVLIGALMLRATLNLYVLRPTDALMDVSRLESFGCTDLSNILAIEGEALNLRGGHDDYERAISIFNLSTQLQPSTIVSSDRPLQLIDAIGNRAKAYYGLAQFDECIRDSEHVLELMSGVNLTPPESMLYLKLAYTSIIASYLRLGNIGQARMHAEQWLLKSDDPYARYTISQLALESDQGRQHWLETFEHRAPVY